MLFRSIRLRNSHPAFNGQFELLASEAEAMHLRWQAGEDVATLWVNLRSREAKISASPGGPCDALTLTAWAADTALI